MAAIVAWCCGYVLCCATVAGNNRTERVQLRCNHGIARHGSDTTGRVVLRHSLNFHNFLVRKADSDAASATAVVVKSRGTIPGTLNVNVFRTRRRRSFSFILADPNLFGVLVAAGA